MLSRPLITGRIRKWSLALSEFTLVYFPRKSINGQASANFLVDHPLVEIQPEKDVELGIYEVERRPWILKFDGSSIEKFVGAGIVTISPKGIKTTLSLGMRLLIFPRTMAVNSSDLLPFMPKQMDRQNLLIRC